MKDQFADLFLDAKCSPELHGCYYKRAFDMNCLLSSSSISISTGWERTVHVSRCPALYSGRIFCLIMSGIDYFCVLK